MASVSIWSLPLPDDVIFLPAPPVAHSAMPMSQVGSEGAIPATMDGDRVSPRNQRFGRPIFKNKEDVSFIFNGVIPAWKSRQCEYLRGGKK